MATARLRVMERANIDGEPQVAKLASLCIAIVYPSSVIISILALAGLCIAICCGTIPEPAGPPLSPCWRCQHDLENAFGTRTVLQRQLSCAVQ